MRFLLLALPILLATPAVAAEINPGATFKVRYDHFLKPVGKDHGCLLAAQGTVKIISLDGEFIYSPDSRFPTKGQCQENSKFIQPGVQKLVFFAQSTLDLSKEQEQAFDRLMRIPRPESMISQR